MAMSRDYKAAPPKPKSPENRPSGSGKSGNPLVIGLLIGLLIGIALSVGVALTVNKSESAFHEKAPPAPGIPIPPPQPAEKKTDAEAAKPAETGEISSAAQEKSAETPEKKPDAKADPGKKEDRFTFYDILTDSQPPVVKPEIKPVPEPPSDTSTKPASEKLILQVGAFKTEQEADNTKAKLSLIGMEATVQSVSVPDKGLLHRVRVGPFANQDELNKARAELSKNGFSAELVKTGSSSN